MSFSGIFDPTVKAYFKRHFGGGESSGGTSDDDGLGGFVLIAPFDILSFPTVDYEGATMCRLSETPLTISQMDGGFILIGSMKLPLTTDESVLGERGYGFLAEMEGITVIGESSSGNIAAMSFPETVAEQIGFPSGGFWFVNNSTVDLGSLDFWLVCKP